MTEAMEHANVSGRGFSRSDGDSAREPNPCTRVEQREVAGGRAC